MHHAHWYCGSGIRMGTVVTAGRCSMMSGASDGTQRLGAGMVCKLLRSCLVFGGGCRLELWLLSTLTSPCELVCASSQQGIWVLRAGVLREGTDATVPFIWPGLGSHVASLLPHLLVREVKSAWDHTEKIQTSAFSGRMSVTIQMHLGLGGWGVVLVWSPFEMQSATVCICGEWSQPSYKTEAFTFFIL